MKDGQADAFFSYFRRRYREWPPFPKFYNLALKALMEVEEEPTLDSIDNALRDMAEVLDISLTPIEGGERLFLINNDKVRSMYNIVKEFPFLLGILEIEEFRSVSFYIGKKVTIIDLFQ